MRRSRADIFFEPTLEELARRELPADWEAADPPPNAFEVICGGVAPGPEAITALSRLDASQLDTGGRIDAAAAWTRCVSYVQAQALKADALTLEPLPEELADSCRPAQDEPDFRER